MRIGKRRVLSKKRTVRPPDIFAISESDYASAIMKWDNIINNRIKNFHPASFAMVMATGIVSIAFEAMAFSGIARTLFALNLVFYLGLSFFLLTRMVFFLPDLMSDLRILRRALLSLTFVVGTNTIGIQLILFYQAVPLAIFLWFIALTGWLICNYFILFNLIAMREQALCKIVNGTTLLIAVSATSISLLGICLLNAMNMSDGLAYLAAGGFWFLGFVSYLIIITLLIYCLFFRQSDPVSWDAPYWICMGAAAIITLTGSEFITRMHLPPTWNNLRETVLWMTVFAWIIGTSWIPYLLFRDIQKFTCAGISAPVSFWIKTFPWLKLAFDKEYHTYDPSSWSRVFPMGMYTASLLSLTHATGYEFLTLISQYWGWFALLVWFLTLIGLLRSV